MYWFIHSGRPLRNTATTGMPSALSFLIKASSLSSPGLYSKVAMSPWNSAYGFSPNTTTATSGLVL